VVGRELAFGRVQIRNTEHLGSFAVYIDGQLLARNEPETRVLAGQRTVTVTRRGPLGDQPVARFEVDVVPDTVVTVSLEPPEGAADLPPETSQPPEREESDPSGAPRETGALVVESTPPGATVRLDGTEIGTTPLEMFGVETGRYELELDKPLFRRAVAAVDVQSNRSTELSEPLQVDAGHPEIAPRLIRPAAPSIAGLVSAGIKGAYLGWTMGSGNSWHYNSFRQAAPLLSVLDFAAMSAIHAGTLVAGDAPASMIVSLANAALLAGPAVAASLSSELLGYDLTGQPWYSTFAAGAAIGGSIAFALYDIAFTPSVAQRTNGALLSDVQASGSVPPPPEVSPRRVLVGAGAGALGRISYVQELFRGYGRAELGVGASLAPGDSFRALPVGTLRLAARPFAGRVPGAQPELSAILQGETDFDTYGVAFGGAIGTVWSFQLPLRPAHQEAAVLLFGRGELMRRCTVTLRRIAGVVTVTLAIAACSLDVLRHAGAVDLLFTDEGPPTLYAAYLFDGDLSDAVGGTALASQDAEFGEDRAGNGSSALHVFNDVEAALSGGALPRTLSVWVRIPDISVQLDVDQGGGLNIGLEGQASGAEEWEHTELKLRVRYSTWSGEARLSYEARVHFEASGDHLEYEGVTVGSPVGGSDPWRLGAWNHLALLWDRAGYVSLFVNGDVVGTTGRPIPDEALASLAHVMVHSESGGYDPEEDMATEPVTMSMDEFLLFESALRADQILAIAEDRYELPLD
jgi:hypothetical protein